MQQAKSFEQKLRGIVFDIDGVIFDSRNANIGYYNAILAAMNICPMSADDELYCHMATGQQAIERIVPPEYRARAMEVKKTIQYAHYVLPKLSLEPGLLETLAFLREAHVPCGICTNRFDGVDNLLHHFGLDRYFSVLKTAKTCAPKPDPQGLLEIQREWGLSPRELAFIGDTPADQVAARRAGSVFIAFRSPELEADLHASDFFSFIDTIQPLVENW